MCAFAQLCYTKYVGTFFLITFDLLIEPNKTSGLIFYIALVPGVCYATNYKHTFVSFR